jgi:putative ABC transport system permease protein
MNKKPSSYCLRFFRWYCDPDYVEDIEGDLLERFEQRQQQGKAANRLLYLDVIRLFRPGIIRNFSRTQKLNNYGMFKNYFITSVRFIKREKAFAFMNIFGLALGIACALIAFKMVSHELSFNQHYDNYDRLYRLINEDQTPQGTVYSRGQVHPLAGALRAEYPNINATMTYYAKEGLIAIDHGNDQVSRYMEKSGIAYVEPEFFQLFSFEFLAGSDASALDETGKVVITKKVAEKYFGLADGEWQEALGRSIRIENSKTAYVSAVVENQPKSNDFPFEVMFHYKDQGVSNRWYNGGTRWDDYSSNTNCYVLLGKNMDPVNMEAQLVDFVDKYLPDYAAKTRSYRLQAFEELHHSKKIRTTYAGTTATKDELMIMGLIGLFLVITACINFINLTTAQTVKRSKEVGVRKTMGSGRAHLIYQFLTETFLITVIACLLGFGLAWLLAGQVETIFASAVTIDLFSGMDTLLFLGILMVGVTLLSGSYPALILSKLNPILAVKNNLNVRQTSGFLSLRRGLVVLQFAITQLLIISILVLNAQLDFWKSKDLGFSKESIVHMKLPQKDSANLEVLKNELLAHSSISGVTIATSGPMSDWRSSNPIFHPNIEGEEHWGNLKNVDEDYFELYGLELIAGRYRTDSDPMNNVVINRQIAEILGFENPSDCLGQSIQYGRGDMQLVVVGVVEDFHAGSLRGRMENVLLAGYPFNLMQVAVALNTPQGDYTTVKSSIDHIEEVWLSQYPEQVFDFSFYDEQLNAFYQLEESVGQMANIFAIMAVIIGSLGLYGLVAFMSNQKSKEIGIRKVMGASSWRILNIFSSELLLLMGIAFIIAAPLSYWILSSWLDYYEYRITIGPSFFIVALLTSIVVTILTVGSKSFKVANENPILSLRDE